MLKTITALLLILIPTSGSIAQNSKEMDFTNALRNKIRIVQHLALNPLLVKAVQKQNALKIDKKTINTRVENWDTEEYDELKIEMQSGNHAKIIKSFIERDNTFDQVFLTDSQGISVSAYPNTDDYWHGNKELWLQSFNKRNGQVYISPLQRDIETNSIYTHVSAPVLDRDKTIGVLVVGIKLTNIAGTTR